MTIRSGRGLCGRNAPDVQTYGVGAVDRGLLHRRYRQQRGCNEGKAATSAGARRGRPPRRAMLATLRRRNGRMAQTSHQSCSPSSSQSMPVGTTPLG